MLVGQAHLISSVNFKSWLIFRTTGGPTSGNPKLDADGFRAGHEFGGEQVRRDSTLGPTPNIVEIE